MGLKRRLVQGLVWVGVSLSGAAWAQDLPRLVQQEGRATLMVDGKPYFMLGAQVDNSSGWPDRLRQVWPAAERMRLNTLEVPVYWEQMEPERGRFDFTVVDDVLAQARAKRKHKVPVGSVVVWDVEERQDALCAGVGEAGYGDVSADEDEDGRGD